MDEVGVGVGQLDDGVVDSGAVLGAGLGEQPAAEQLQLLHGSCRHTERRRSNRPNWSGTHQSRSHTC